MAWTSRCRFVSNLRLFPTPRQSCTMSHFMRLSLCGAVCCSHSTHASCILRCFHRDGDISVLLLQEFKLPVCAAARRRAALVAYRAFCSIVHLCLKLKLFASGCAASAVLIATLSAAFSCFDDCRRAWTLRLPPTLQTPSFLKHPFIT